MTREQLRERVGRMVTVSEDAGGWVVRVAPWLVDAHALRHAATKVRTQVVESIMAALWPEGDA